MLQGKKLTEATMKKKFKPKQNLDYSERNGVK